MRIIRAQSAPPADSRFTDDDAVQQIRVLCAQLLNLQDRASVREVASATIATLLENCGSSHASTLRPPPNSPPHALKNDSGVYVLDKATSTSCDEMPSTSSPPSAPQCRCQPLSAGAAMTDINAAAMCVCASAVAASTYPSCSIRCMCSESGIDEQPAPDAVRTEAEAGAGDRPPSRTVLARSRSPATPPTPSPDNPPAGGHSNILVYAQLGNSCRPAAAAALEVDEELNRNSIVLDDTDYHANDCALEHEPDGAAAASSSGTKLVLDLDDRTKYTKEVSV